LEADYSSFAGEAKTTSGLTAGGLAERIHKEVAFMTNRVAKLSFVAAFLVGLFALAQIAQAQNPTPAPLNRPDYNYTESSGCTSCHFSRGAGGDHMLEAVGVAFNDTTRVFSFTGNGWRASTHAVSNYKSTQNTYCAKCHSPLQAKPEATFKKGILINTEPIADGAMEGVTCAVCHPSHNAAVVLGRRLGLYKWGMDKATPEAYEVVKEGEEDLLCLSCHINRHDENVAAFKVMYDSGVKCVDCHMAEYGTILGTEVPKRFHDFKVAKNLPYSCGVEGSVSHCHPGYTTEGTLMFLPYVKQQHNGWWPLKPGKMKNKNQASPAEFTALWQQMEAEAAKR
jgi:hypothetical protein